MATNTTTYDDVLNFMRTQPLTQEQRTQLVRVFNAQAKFAKAVAASRLYVGQRVEWEGKNGLTKRGQITKVGRSNAHVLADNGVQWYCAASLLRAI